MRRSRPSGELRPGEEHFNSTLLSMSSNYQRGRPNSAAARHKHRPRRRQGQTPGRSRAGPSQTPTAGQANQPAGTDGRPANSSRVVRRIYDFRLLEHEELFFSNCKLQAVLFQFLFLTGRSTNYVYRRVVVFQHVCQWASNKKGQIVNQF